MDPEDSSSVLACPDDAICPGGEAMPWPQPGFWVDRSALIYGAEVYPCPRDTCKGGANSSCWAIEAYNSSSNLVCDANALQCAEGSAGPMCVIYTP